MNVETTLRALLGQLETPFTGESLFDHLPDLVYFIKNADCQYLVANRTLVERCGLRDKSELLGRTSSEVFRPPLGAGFEAQDRKVLDTGRPLIAQLELHLYPSNDVGWCLTTKLPLMTTEGRAVGLVGVSQDLRLPDSSTREFRNLLAAVKHAEKNIATPPTVPELAAIAGMSRYQLDRRMRGVFGLTTGQWLLKLRLDHARQLLTETSKPVSQIATSAGYSDQSAFSRQFAQATGLTPGEYRSERKVTGTR